MSLGALLMFVPDQVLALGLVALGIGFLFGLVRGRTVVGLLVLLLLLPALGELFDAALDAMPTWLFVLVMIGLVVMIVRALFALVIGEGATNHLVGSLAASVVKGAFALLVFPFRLLWHRW